MKLLKMSYRDETKSRNFLNNLFSSTYASDSPIIEPISFKLDMWPFIYEPFMKFSENFIEDRKNGRYTNE